MRNKLSSKVKRKTLMLSDEQSIQHTKIAAEVHKDQQPIYKRAKFKRTQSNPLKIDIDAYSSVNIDTSFDPISPLRLQIKTPKGNGVNFYQLNTSRSQNKIKRVLSFTPKGQSKNLPIQQPKLSIKQQIIVIAEQFKSLINLFKQFFLDIKEKMKLFAETTKTDFEDSFKKISFNLTHLQEKIVFKDIPKAQNPVQKQKIIKVEEVYKVPQLNFQSLLKQSETEQQYKVNKPQQIRKNFNQRQVKTQRHVKKSFQFDPPARVNRKFSTFNQTLTKIKRLSFEGAIIKL